MLQSIRERIHGWVAGILIGIISVSFLMWGLEYYVNQFGNGGSAVAEVNGKKISDQALSNAFQEIQRAEQSKMGGAPLTAQMNDQLKKIALQAIITKSALLQNAQDAGFYVSMNQVKQMIMTIPQFQEGGKFSLKKFQEVLYANASTPTQFLQSMQANLLTNQVSAGLEGSSFSLPNEVKNAYLLLKQTRQFGYFIVPASQYVSSIQVSENAVKDYYNQHKDDFKQPEKVSVSYLLLSPQQLSQKVKVSPEEVKQYYENNKASYTSSIQWQISQITIPVVANASAKEVNAAKAKADQLASSLQNNKTDFSGLMKNSTADHISSQAWFSQDQLPTPLVKIIANMQLNQISAPIRTKQGFTVIKLDAIKPGKTKPFDDVKSNIEKLLVHQKTEQIFSAKSDQLSNLTYTNPNTLDVAAKALGLKINTSPLITRKGEAKGILSKASVLAVVFSDGVLKSGNNSNPITLKDGSLMVVRVNKRLPSKVLSFSEVENKIKNIIIRQRSTRKAGLVAYKIQTALSKGESAKDMASKYKLTWSEHKNVSRTDKAIPNEILSTAFDLPVPISKQYSVQSKLLPNGDYAVIKLFAISLPNYTSAKAHQRKILGINLANFYGQMSYRAYVKSVIDNSKIKIYDKSL